MSIIQNIRDRISNIFRKPKEKGNIEYRTTTTYDGNRKPHIKRDETIVSSSPPPESAHEKFTRRINKMTDRVKGMFGGNTPQQESAHDPTPAQKTIEHAKTLFGDIAKSTSSMAKTQINAIVKREQNKTILQSIAAPGNFFIKAMTGKDPGKYYKEPKKNRFGARLSKREMKALQKKYGKHWSQTIQKDKKGFYTQTSPADMSSIRRMNKMEQSQMNFGIDIPNSNIYLTEESARIPFSRREDNGFDINAMFMGETGQSIVTKQSFDINSGFNKKNKKVQPLYIGGGVF